MTHAVITFGSQTNFQNFRDEFLQIEDFHDLESTRWLPETDVCKIDVLDFDLYRLDLEQLVETFGGYVAFEATHKPLTKGPPKGGENV